MKKKLTLIFALLMSSMVVFSQKKKKSDTKPDVLAETMPMATSATERLNGFEQRKKMIANSLLKNLTFKNVGPTVMSGRVVDIDANPNNPSEFYVAYASGGLWHTVNNGQSFTPLFDNEAVMTIGDIAVNWQTRTIWLGTGENNSSRSSYSGVGMYKSLDGGKTWEHLGLPESHHIGRIALHPTDPNTVWVAVLGHLYSENKERGMYKTNDGGKTWKQTLYINENTGAIDVKIDPLHTNILYATMWHKERKAWNFVESGSESGIYKSIDAGETWQLISVPESGFPTGNGNGRIGLAIYPQNTNILYAIVDNQANRPKKEAKEEGNKLTQKILKKLTNEEFLAQTDASINEYLDSEGFPEKYTAKSLKEEIRKGKTSVKDIYQYTHNGNDDLFDTQISGAEVYRSEDAGKTWKRTHEDYLDNVYFTYGYYFGQIWVDPTNDKKIVIVGVPILRSDDGGKSFKSIERENVHSDHHALWFNPKDSKHYINGNDGGINITYDDGKTWFKANSLPVGQLYHVSVDMAKPYHVYGGLQDNGVWYGSSTNAFDYNYGIFDNGDGYKFLLGGDGMQVQVDWRDNNTVYAGFQFGNYFRINKATNERKRLDVPRELGEAPYRFNWEAPLTISRHNQDIIYFGSNKFHRSLEKGDNFKTLSGDLTKGVKEGDVPFGTLTTIEESPIRFGLIYTGSDDGLVYVSKDGGYSFEKIMDKNLWISGIAASNHKESRVYVSLNAYRNDHFNAYLYVSEDYGKNWTPIGSDLPAEPINVVKEDPKNENILYIGTDNGLYISIDRGKSFMNANGMGLPNVSIHDLVIHPRENELVVGTHGRSIYIADVKPLQALTDEMLAKNIHVNDLSTITYNNNWGKMFDKYVEPEERKYPINYYSKSSGKLSLKVQTEDGITLKTIEEDAEAGLNTLNFNQAIDETQKEVYEKYLNSTKKAEEKEVKLAPADDKKIYFRPGKYQFVFEINGEKISKTLEIKAPEKRARRNMAPKPTASPEEFEEWYEEMGFEETKK